MYLQKLIFWDIFVLTIIKSHCKHRITSFSSQILLLLPKVWFLRVPKFWFAYWRPVRNFDKTISMRLDWKKNKESTEHHDIANWRFAWLCNEIYRIYGDNYFGLDFIQFWLWKSNRRQLFSSENRSAILFYLENMFSHRRCLFLQSKIFSPPSLAFG